MSTQGVAPPGKFSGDTHVDILPIKVKKCNFELDSQRHLDNTKVNLTNSTEDKKLGTIKKRRYLTKLNEKNIEWKHEENSKLNCRENLSNVEKIDKIPV